MVRKNGDGDEAEYDAIILSKQTVVPEKTGMIQTGGNPPEDELLLLISFTIEEGDHDDMVGYSTNSEADDDKSIESHVVSTPTIP